MLEFLSSSPYLELTSILVLSALVGLVGNWLRQPMVVGFIAVGILAGPSGLAIVESSQNINLLAELGIAVLLFMVGLKLDIKLIKTLGKVSVATGLGQVVFTSLIGFFIGISLGLDWLTSTYVAVALTFSSTIIIVKLLSDKKEVDSLHGRIAIGFLIVQDLVVVLAMMVLSSIGIGADSLTGGWEQILKLLVYTGFFVGFTVLFARHVADGLLHRVARVPELFIIFGIAWAALFAAIGGEMGLSKELGGLLAGVSLASTPYREVLVARLASLREFLLLFFFVALGSHLDLSLLGEQVNRALVFSIFVLIGNPLIVLVILGYMGYQKRTGLLAGLTVAQISEFSLIFMAMGVSLGHVNASSLGLVTLVGLITIAVSVYMITYSHQVYRFLEPALGVFERSKPSQMTADYTADSKTQYDVVIYGLGRYGSAVASLLTQKKVSFLALDFNPAEVRRYQEKGYIVKYADACDLDALAELPITNAKWVIIALPQHDLGLTHEDPRLVLLEGLKELGYKGQVAVATYHSEEASALLARGADLILHPFEDAALKLDKYF